MNKLKDVKIHDTLPTNMGGIRVETGLISKESVDAGTIDECVGIDSTNKPVRGEGAGTSTIEINKQSIANPEPLKNIVLDGIPYLVDFEDILKQVAGFDGNKIQTLKNVGGTFMWVTDE